MGSKHLVEILRDDPGHYLPDVLDRLWGEMPVRYRTTDLDAAGLHSTDMAVFSMSATSRGFRLRFEAVGEPMDRELAWCCWHIIEMGGRVPVSVAQSLLKWLTAALEDHPGLRGSLMEQPPRKWERAMAAAFARRHGALPSQNWNLRNTCAFLRRCYRMLWTAYDQRPWWQHEEWNLALDPRIPRRLHEPAQGTSLHFHTIEPGLAAYRSAMVVQGLAGNRHADLEQPARHPIGHRRVLRLAHRPCSDTTALAQR